MTKNHPSLRKAASTAGISTDYNRPANSTEQRPESSNMDAHFFDRLSYRPDLRLQDIAEYGRNLPRPRASVHSLESQPLDEDALSQLNSLSRRQNVFLQQLHEQSSTGSNRFQRPSAESFSPCIVRSNPAPMFDLPSRPFVPQPGENLGDTPSAYARSSTAVPPIPPKEPIPEPQKTLKPEDYAGPFCDFMTNHPTVYHAVEGISKELESNGYKKLSERDSWDLKAGGKYYVERNGSSLIAFAIGDKFKAGNGAAILAGHIDALTAKLKPVSNLKTKAGYVQLAVAPYAGALNDTWWDRDLGIGGRVLVKESSGKIVTKLVKLGWPIARIPTLAPHFGAAAAGPFNKETNMVPIIGLDNSDLTGQTQEESFKPALLGGEGSFTATQPPRLVRAISSELGITDYSKIINWDLELFDVQPATLGGLDKEFIFAGRIDDKLCSWAAYQALINSTKDLSTSSQVKVVGLFDNEEIGSLLRQGARGNFLPTVISRVVDSFAPSDAGAASLLSQTYANSFLVSSDVIHAVNPNFLNAYLENHSPRLNVGLVVSADPNGHMTTDAVSTAILQRVAEKSGQTLQIFQIRNDSRSGGTVGPMLSSKTGIRAIDAGIPQLSMHSIRATTGSKDPGLGIAIFQGFLDHFEEVDKEFTD